MTIHYTCTCEVPGSAVCPFCREYEQALAVGRKYLETGGITVFFNQ